MAFTPSASKEDAIRRLNEILGTNEEIGIGSSVSSALFDAATARLGLSNAGPMPDRGRRVVEAAGLSWDAEHWSRGSTVTLAGLNRMIEALERRSGESSATKVNAAGLGVAYRARTGGVNAQPTELVRNWDALDEATRAHQRLESALADVVRAAGHSPRSPGSGEPDFDLAWEVDGTVIVAEVKSANPSNHRQQARLALGQVIEYRTRLSAIHDSVRAVVLLGDPVTQLDREMGASAGVLFGDLASLHVLLP